MKDFEVHPAAMRKHAEHVGSVGDRIGKAAGTAGETTSHTEMYGVIGQLLVPAVLATEGAALAAIKTAEATTRTIGTGVKDMAELYEQNEDEIKKLIEAIHVGEQD